MHFLLLFVAYSYYYYSAISDIYAILCKIQINEVHTFLKLTILLRINLQSNELTSTYNNIKKTIYNNELFLIKP
jgi:hypothetical protein